MNIVVLDAVDELVLYNKLYVEERGKFLSSFKTQNKVDIFNYELDDNENLLIDKIDN